MSEVSVYYDNASALALYLQLDDDDNTKLAFTEGTVNRLRRYVVTSDQLVDADISAGKYYPTIRQGDINDPQSTDPILDVQTLVWSGSGEATNNSGGGVLFAQIGVLALAPDEFYEVVQGENKVITFVVGVKGRFQQAIATDISVKLRDIKKDSQTVTNDAINRVTQELDIQVFRATITAIQTAALNPGLIQVEISLDDQKTVLTHSLKLLEAIE